MRSVELGRRSGGRDAEGVDTDDLFSVRVVDERLRLTAPAQRVPHRARGCDHRGGGVDGIAALLKDHRTGRGGQRLSGHRHPMRCVEWRFLRALSEDGSGDQQYKRSFAKHSGGL